jgi:regulator of sigma E protease
MGFLSSISSIVAIIFGFGVLIFIHELGHFLAAKWAGIRTEAFAVGMGPVICSWRKGIGFAFGSTERKVKKRTGKSAVELNDEELERHNIGETEYSLRWLPIGGFVKMLGQEDANPKAVSDDPRSYNRTGIGKRMVVVSAGVIMNVLLAMVLFIWAFMVGVQFVAPVISGSVAGTASASAMPTNAEAFGVLEPGFMPGDRVLFIDGDEVRTFADVRIAAAMAKPGESLAMTIQRMGCSEPLEFSITPAVSEQSGLLSIGAVPGASTMLIGDKSSYDTVLKGLETLGLKQQGVMPGMELATVEGEPVFEYGQLEKIVSARGGAPVRTEWRAVDQGEIRIVEAVLDATPEWDAFTRYDESGEFGEYDVGLLGLAPLTRISEVMPDSPNRDILRSDDVILRIGQQHYPRISQVQTIVADHAGETVALQVERDGETHDLVVEVSRKGQIGVGLSLLESDPRAADPIHEIHVLANDENKPFTSHATPIAAAQLLPGSAVTKINDVAVADWRGVFIALRAETEDACAAGEGATFALTIRNPTPGAEITTVDVPLTADDVRTLHELQWRCELDARYFDPIMETLSAHGNPITAITMGFRETHKMIVLTYLTIDRLFRGSVGVKQLRGPVGIIDLGSKILPQGFMYFLFFLGMISVNLAVINFLPIPIVDGGTLPLPHLREVQGRTAVNRLPERGDHRGSVPHRLHFSHHVLQRHHAADRLIGVEGALRHDPGASSDHHRGRVRRGTRDVSAPR